MCFGVSLDKIELQWLAMKKNMISQRYPMLQRQTIQKNITSFQWLLSKMMAKSAIQLDYDTLPPKVFVKCLMDLYNSQSSTSEHEERILPVMASGHVKEAPNCDNMHRILDQIHTTLKDKVVYWTLQDAVTYWLRWQPL
jgi:hypothetical protein